MNDEAKERVLDADLVNWLGGDENALGVDIWYSKYQDKSCNETFNQWIDRISNGDKDLKQLILNKEFLFGGRILSNRGLQNKGYKITYSNCYVCSPPEDNIESIFECASKLARTYSYGGGCGIDISKLAPRGAVVRNSARETSGAVTFMDLYSLVTELIGQNGRRGALMITLDCTHPDLLDFINIKKDLDRVNKANISIKVTSEFMEAVKNREMFDLEFTRTETGETIKKTVNAYDIFKQFAQNNWEMAEPGLLFWDRVSNYNLLSENENFEYAGTNPCVSGDTKVLTSTGYLSIKKLAETNESVTIWNGFAWSKVKPKVTGENQKMKRIHFSNGIHIDCTYYHKFVLNDALNTKIEAEKLSIGDEISFCEYPVIYNENGYKIEDAFIKGQRFDEVIHTIPGGQYTLKSRLNWLGGYIFNRTKRVNENTVCLFEQEKTAVRFKYLLNTLGCDVSIRKYYGYEVTIPKNTLLYLYRLGCPIDKIIRNNKDRYYKDQLINVDGHPITVKAIEDIPDAKKVYCFKEPVRHTAVFNGIMTGNCGEEPLPAGGSCLLGSLNLSAFVNDGKFNYVKFRKAVRVAIRALNDCLIEGLPLHPLQEQRDSVSKLRQIGLGIMGLADCLIKMGLKYGSPESIEACESIAKTLIRTSLHESSRLAEEAGSSYEGFNAKEVIESDFFKAVGTDKLAYRIRKYGLFNSQLLTCAPTGTISTMLGISGGIEPIFANYYTRKTISLKGHDEYYKVYTPIVKEYMDKNGLENDDRLPEYFVTAQTIDYHNRVDMQSIWQKFIDASISSTVNLPESTTVEDIIDLYIYAYEKGLKGITVYRDNCQREGILTTEKKDKELVTTDTKGLKRGVVIKVNNNAVGIERHLMTGCGSLHCSAFFDPSTGDLVESYLSKGSTGGCQSNLAAVSRLISLAARAGVSVHDIADQLDSCMTCPSYAVRTATKHDTSPGSCCPVAVGKALVSMYEEFNKKYINTNITSIESIEICKPLPLDTKLSEQELIDKGICPVCGNELTHRNGCVECDCGWSRCS